jgi:hypothetical protein
MNSAVVISSVQNVAFECDIIVPLLTRQGCDLAVGLGRWDLFFDVERQNERRARM